MVEFGSIVLFKGGVKQDRGQHVLYLFVKFYFHFCHRMIKKLS